MSQELEGIDIYQCPFFEVDSSGRLKFISGAYYDRVPESFKTINDISNVIRFCTWIIKKKDAIDVSKYAALVYMNRVQSNLQKIERDYRKLLRVRQLNQQKNLNKSVNTPGKTYL